MPLSLPLLTFLLTFTTLVSSRHIPIIQTTSGKLQGIPISSSTDAYLGIPFAIPPVGSLRFAAPRALVTPKVARNATAFGPACIQLPYGGTTQSPTGESEECLTINVWTSCAVSNASRMQSPKPVLIWMYGGGWNRGSSSFACRYLLSVCPDS
jgi:carboxylesterase type B